MSPAIPRAAGETSAAGPPRWRSLRSPKLGPGGAEAKARWVIAVGAHHPFMPAFGAEKELVHRECVEELVGHQQKRAFRHFSQ